MDSQLSHGTQQLRRNESTARIGQAAKTDAIPLVVQPKRGYTGQKEQSKRQEIKI